MWDKKEAVPGLPLAEADYTSLALELAVREVDGWRDILATQHARIENPDRKGRFKFVMPALSADPAEREQWFASLSDVDNRRREPWVLEGVSYLHHPLRAEASAKYVAPSLDAAVGDSEDRRYLFSQALDGRHAFGTHRAGRGGRRKRVPGDLPANYPARLRNIVVQSADELFRAAALVQ